MHTQFQGNRFSFRSLLPAMLALAALSGCGGGGDSGGGGGGGGGTSSYTIGGSVSGLTGAGLVLENNAGDNLTVAAGATTFTFSTAVSSGAAYAVTVLTQPSNPDETCTVSGGSGTVGSANVASVAITCSSSSFKVGGSITGLTSAGLVLQDNAGDNLTVAANATSFTFPTAVASGHAYAVTVLTQPSSPAETCTVTGGTGTVTTAPVTSVAIACVRKSFTVGGTISGLTGTGLVLENNGGDSLTIPANATSFTFKTPLLPGTAYTVTVATQPSGPKENCTVTNAAGSLPNGNVTNIAISCNAFGRFVYVVNGADGDVSGFTINGDGTLTAMTSGPFTADSGPTSIAVDATGEYVYVTNKQSEDVSIFTADPNTGALTLQTQALTHATGGTSIAITPSDQYVFVGGFSSPNASLFGFSLAPATGLLTADPNSPYGASNTPVGLAIDPTNQFLFATAFNHHAVHTYEIGTPATGLLTEIASSPANTYSEPYEIVVSPLGTAQGGYVFTADAGVGRVDVFSYDSGGNLTEVPNAPFPSGPGAQGLAIDPTGTYLYVTNFTDGSVSSFSIGSTGQLTAIQAGGSAVATGATSNPGPTDIKVDPNGPYVYVVNSSEGTVTAFSTAQGVLTQLRTYPTGSGSGSGPVALAID